MATTAQPWSFDVIRVDQLSNIAFIKTHKTASTTLASILYRYGKRHDLNIAKFDQGGTYIDLDVAANQVRLRYKVKIWLPF